MPKKNSLQKLLVYLRPYHGVLGVAVLLMLISAAFDVFWPLLIQRAIDIYIANRDQAGLLRYTLLIVGAVLTSVVATSIRMRMVIKTGQSIIKKIRSDLFLHLQKLPVAFFDRIPVGKIMTRLTSDVDALTRLFEAGIVSIIVDSLMLIGVIAAMFFLNLKLALLMLVQLPILIFVTFYLRPIILDTEDNIREDTSKLNAKAQEIISGVKVVQAFNAEEFFAKCYDSANQNLKESSIKAVNVWSYYWPLVDFTYYLGLALIILSGGKMAHNGTITIGTVLAFIIYAGRLFHPLRSLAQASRIIQQAKAGADRITAILETPVEEEGQDIMPPIKGEVVFENINFSYDEKEVVLKNFNLKANPGEMIALVGHTGAGKTSVINLLTRFYSPQSGSILVDGIDITKVKLASYRKQVGLVLQDPFLFSGTLRDNLKRGYPSASDSEMNQVLEIVGFSQEDSPSLDFILTERGQNLSFGERQLISFARALLAKPRILILDEATAHVDTLTEQRVQEGLRVLLKDRTSFVIAHRLSTIHQADQIVVLGEGRILELGTHQELLSTKKEYYSLLQAANAK